MSQYVVAVKREQRVNAKEDWFKPALAIKKLKILSLTDKLRIIVECDDESIDRLRAVLSPLCHIEKRIEHLPRKF
ncbi:MAG: hypothetical protein OXL41_07345 [Nitrospinae bacterium]|nr:hypothetical protein [Nitrospinota bacterium]